EYADMRPRVCREMSARAPRDAVGGIERVRKPEVAERDVDRLGGRNPQRRVPQKAALTSKEKAARIRRGADAARNELDQLQQRRGGRTGLGLGEHLLPVIDCDEARLGRESRPPAVREAASEGRGGKPADEAVHSLLAEALHKAVGQRGA